MPAARPGGKCEDGVGRAGMPAPSDTAGHTGDRSDDHRRLAYRLLKMALSFELE